MTTEKPPSITDAQRRFCDEYLVDFNATAAYARAGYKSRGRSAQTCAGRLLTKPEVSAYLAERKSSLAQATEVSLRRVVQEVEAVLLSNPKDLFDTEGKIHKMNEMPDHIARCISGYEVGDRGKLKITFWDKLQAAEKLLKLHSAYPEKRQEGPRETIVGVVVLPAKQPYQGHQPQAIEGESRRVERTEPLAPPRTKFVVPLVAK